MKLRTQVVVVAGLVQLYALGVGASYWVESRAHARLEARFDQSLAVLTRLPRLRDRLRRLELATNQYLLTGQSAWLERREEALREARRIGEALSERMSEGEGRELLAQMDRRLTAYLAETSQWVSRRRAGRLTSADAAAAARERGLEAAAEPLSRLGEAQADELRAAREELERAGRQTVLFIVLAGAAAAGFTALFLGRFLTGPLSALRERARAWTLGRPWPDERPPASAELEDLYASMAEMAGRLNLQYEREAELGRLKGSLVSMVSHEFNNALSVLGGTVNLLRVTEPAPPAGRRAEYYQVVETNLRALALAASNLLDLGRLEDGRFAVRPRRAELGRVLADALKALEPLYERKNLRVSLSVPADAPPANADPDALLMVATNLIGNAVKYTPEGGSIEAGVRAEPGGVRVYVSDTGIGIAPEDRQRVLEGHRTEAGRRTAHGFGVGLTLVKRVLDAHRAVLEIAGEPGKGSRFSFVLPRWEGQGEARLFADPA